VTLDGKCLLLQATLAARPAGLTSRGLSGELRTVLSLDPRCSALDPPFLRHKKARAVEAWGAAGVCHAAPRDSYGSCLIARASVPRPHVVTMPVLYVCISERFCGAKAREALLKMGGGATLAHKKSRPARKHDGRLLRGATPEGVSSPRGAKKCLRILLLVTKRIAGQDWLHCRKFNPLCGRCQASSFTPAKTHPRRSALREGSLGGFPPEDPVRG
jgi:hypothetical protein